MPIILVMRHSANTYPAEPKNILKRSTNLKIKVVSIFLPLLWSI